MWRKRRIRNERKRKRRKGRERKEDKRRRRRERGFINVREKVCARHPGQ